MSIKPLHSLISGVMEGAGAPGLIVSGAVSPHDFALRPSDVRKLNRADIVFWIGPGLEAGLVKPLAALGEKARVIGLARVKFMKIRPLGDGPGGGVDPHLWLDPKNARAVVAVAVAELSALDPGNAGLYRDNGERLSKRLDNLDLELKLKLTPIANEPFIVHHDASGYLADAYGLNLLGFLTRDPDHPLRAGRLRELRRLVIEEKARCLFKEPGVDNRRLTPVTEGTDVVIAVLDPLGAGLEAGPDMYFNLLRANADALSQCLGRRGGG
ncbi:MAG: zinc ABC transporter substrate-binding protein [Rhodospirillales bacterium]